MIELNDGFSKDASGAADLYGSSQKAAPQGVNHNDFLLSTDYSDPDKGVWADDWNAGRLQTQMQKKSESDYQQNYRPIIKQLNESALYDKDAGGQDIEKVARAGAHLGNKEWTLHNQKLRTQRQQGRLNAHTDALTEREGDYERRTTALSTGLGEIHHSKLNQYARNSSVRDQMINVGREQEASALNNINSAAGAETQRENQNEMIDAQNEASQTAMVAGIAMMAMMFM